MRGLAQASSIDVTRLARLRLVALSYGASRTSHPGRLSEICNYVAALPLLFTPATKARVPRTNDDQHFIP